MRIIDKNTDYYDYLQNSEDTIVFDRRGSKIITKSVEELQAMLTTADTEDDDE